MRERFRTRPNPALFARVTRALSPLTSNHVTQSPSEAGGPMSKLTLDEIATLAGVSRSTVSRALNQQPRVQHIMTHTGYTPNTAAQALAQRRWPIMAIVVTEPIVTLFGNPELGRLMADITAACQINHCLCALYLLNGTELSSAFHAPQVAGVIVLGDQTDRIVSQLQARQLPMITLDHNSPASRSDLAADIQYLLNPRTSHIA